MTISDAIPFYRDCGFNLVPLGGDKRPVMTGKLFRYHWQEWAEKSQSETYWERLPLFDWWGAVQGLGAICGPVSGGLVCLDFDGLADGGHVADVAEALGLSREYAWQVRSPGGGFHLWVRAELELEKGKLRRDGLAAAAVELRYTGHYVALPPSLHPTGNQYEWLYGEPIDAPGAVDAAGLLATYGAITVAPEPKMGYRGGVQGVQGGLERGDLEHEGHEGAKGHEGHEGYVSEGYGQAAMAAELDLLARAAAGGRNDALNTAAFALGQLVADGLLLETEVISKLEITAQAIGLGDGEIGATIGSGLRAGMGKPRGLMVRPAGRGHGHGPTPVIGGVGNLLPVWTVEKPFDLYNYKAEDGGVLDCWMEESGQRWIYVSGLGWLRWGETHWSKEEEDGALSAEIQALLRQMNDLAEYKLEEALESRERPSIEKAAGYVAATKRTAGRVGSVEKMARAQRAVRFERLDGGGNLLNFANCTYDLDRYEARPHDKDDHITHVLGYGYDEAAECPRWEQFCREVLVQKGTTEPDPEIILLFQELVGYALTSETKHEVMAWFQGEGGNGKTVAITIISELLGDLAMTVNFHELGDPSNYSLTHLSGKRLLFSTESERGQTIPEALIKKIVSGETIRAREIRQASFEFRPVAKVFWSINNPPVIRDTSDSIWRRLKILPFPRKFEDNEKDVDLIFKLRKELPGIFRWAVWGLYRLRQQGRFTQAGAATQGVEDLKLDTNPVARWMQERTIATLSPATLATVVYADYVDWCKKNGNAALNSVHLGRELTRLDVGAKRTTLEGKSGTYYALRLFDY